MAVSLPLWAWENSSVELRGADHYPRGPWRALWAGWALRMRNGSVVQAWITPLVRKAPTADMECGSTQPAPWISLWQLQTPVPETTKTTSRRWRGSSDSDVGDEDSAAGAMFLSILVGLQVTHKHSLHVLQKHNAVSVAIILRIQMRKQRLKSELMYSRWTPVFQRWIHVFQGNNLTQSLALFHNYWPRSHWWDGKVGLEHPEPLITQCI